VWPAQMSGPHLFDPVVDATTPDTSAPGRNVERRDAGEYRQSWVFGPGERVGPPAHSVQLSRVALSVS